MRLVDRLILSVGALVCLQVSGCQRESKPQVQATGVEEAAIPMEEYDSGKEAGGRAGVSGVQARDSNPGSVADGAYPARTGPIPDAVMAAANSEADAARPVTGPGSQVQGAAMQDNSAGPRMPAPDIEPQR